MFLAHTIPFPTGFWPDESGYCYSGNPSSHAYCTWTAFIWTRCYTRKYKI